MELVPNDRECNPAEVGSGCMKGTSLQKEVAGCPLWFFAAAVKDAESGE